MIILHLTFDTPTLKACTATCSSWYNVTTPYLHRTLTLREWPFEASFNHRNRRLDPLPSSFRLGLLPLVKKLLFGRAVPVDRWVVPAIFDSRSMQYFRAMVNLQELKIMDLDFSKFPEGFEEHLGHFSPTLRSVALNWPHGTRRQLLNFFRLFPKLNDIEISCYAARREFGAHESQIVPVSGGLRGRLTLKMFGEEGLLKDIAAAFGGMRFTSLDLHNAQGTQLLLEACADTVETLRWHPDDTYDFGKRVSGRWEHFPTTWANVFFSKCSLKPSTYRAAPSFDL
jgi:hypothetical protein